MSRSPSGKAAIRGAGACPTNAVAENRSEPARRMSSAGPRWLSGAHSPDQRGEA